MDAATLDRFAHLIVNFGANVQPGQTLALTVEPGQEYLVRAIATAAYRSGAAFVDLAYFDPWVKRSRIQYASDEALDFIPEWHGQRMLALGDRRCARMKLSGPTAPGLLDDLDPVRVGRDRFPLLKESSKIVNDGTTNWTIAPCPQPAWAALLYPDLEPDDALARLEQRLLHVCRIDEADPVAAWNERFRTLMRAASALNEARFDALHFTGPGTDLRVGLLPSSHWLAADFKTVDGIRHAPNIPSEEVFTAPDPERVDGHVASTKPLVLPGGTIVRDLKVRFEGGRAVAFESSAGGDVLKTMTQVDDGGNRLGEVALVDGEGRIGPLDTVFYDTLLDENAASHIAVGMAYAFTVGAAEDRERMNKSELHVDFMIGGPDVDVDAITRDGTRVPVLHRGAWQIPL